MDDMKEELLAEKEKAEEEADDIKQFFVDAKGNNYDPDKKFGIIRDGTQVLYDNITSSYECYLPPDYYLKYI